VEAASIYLLLDYSGIVRRMTVKQAPFFDGTRGQNRSTMILGSHKVYVPCSLQIISSLH